MKILFDCDGTILDSMHIWIDPMNDIFDKYGKNFLTMAPEEKSRIEALAYEDTVEYIANEIATDMTAEEVDKYFSDNLEHGYREVLMPKEGAVEKIKELHAAGIDMAITSSTNQYYLEKAFRRLGIHELFSFYTTPDITGYKKNQAEYWQYAADKFGVDPSELILYDDALYALKAAKDLGIEVVAVKDFPYNEGEWEEIIEIADQLVDNIDEIDVNALKKR